MRLPKPGAIIVLLAATAWVLLLARAGRADLDPPGPPTVTDWVGITELAFTKDWGDGGGDAEICVDVIFNHPGHKIELEGKAQDAKWLKFDCWEDLEMFRNDPDRDKNLNTPFVLIGQGGKVDQWLSGTHRECVPTAAWEIRVRVTEINGTDVGSILKKVGEALGKGKDPRALLAGALLEAAAPILDQIFGGHDNVGTGQQNYEGSAGDPNGDVERGGTTESSPIRQRRLSGSSSRNQNRTRVRL
jgi:hypothetical protein